MDKNQTILIVEDDALTAFWISTVLQRMGYEIYGPVASGEQAIESAINYKPDYIIMDIWLAGTINGIEAAKEILSVINASVIFISGYTENGLIKQISRVNHAAFLKKPLDPVDLENIFRKD